MTAATTVAQVRFRRLERDYRALAYLTAAVLHLVALYTLPGLPEPTIPVRDDIIRVIDVPPILDIPPPPPKISKPAIPVEATGPAPDEVTIPPTVIDPLASLIPPRDPGEDTPFFTPRDTDPVLRRHFVVYPEYLKRIDIEGTVILWLRINVKGEVERVLVMESSGYLGLDDAAVRGYQNAVFTPAFTRDQPVLVWVQKAVKFSLKN